MANTIASLLVKIGADITKLKAGLGDAEGAAKKSAGNISQTMLKAADGFGKAGTALTLGLTVPLVAFGTASIKAAMDSESAMAELNAVIKSTGGAAGVTAKQVTDYASAMQKVTKFDDEAIVSGQSMLLTFTKIGKDVFPQASTAVLNMAEKFGSVEQAAMQVGKALNDPIAGVANLRRVGVQLSATQEKQVKDFMAVGDAASAQKVILKELETEFGGLAEAAGATTAGKFIQFKNALGDLQEVVGAALLPNLISLTNNLRSLIDGFMAMPAPMQNAIIGFGIFLAALGPISSALSTIITIAAAFAPGGAFASVALGTTVAGTAAGASSVGFGALATAMWALIAPILPIIAAIALVIGAVYLLYWAFSTNFMGITDTAKILATQLIYYFMYLGTVLQAIWGIMVFAWNDTWRIITETLKYAWGTIKKAMVIMATPFVAWWNILVKIGNFIRGVFVTAINWLTMAVNWLIASIRTLGNAFASLKIPDWLTPGSPTPFEMGLRGINDAMKSVSRQGLPDMTQGVKFATVGEMSDLPVMNGGGAAGGGSQTVNLIVDGKMIASERKRVIASSKKAAMQAFAQAIKPR